MIIILTSILGAICSSKSQYMRAGICSQCQTSFSCNGSHMSCDTFVVHKLFADISNLICNSGQINYQLQGNNVSKPCSEDSFLASSNLCEQCPPSFTCINSFVFCGNTLTDLYNSHICIGNEPFPILQNQQQDSQNDSGKRKSADPCSGLIFDDAPDCVACPSSWTCNGTSSVNCGGVSFSISNIAELDVFRCDENAVSCAETAKYYDQGSCQVCKSGFACDGTFLLTCGSLKLRSAIISAFSCEEIGENVELRCGNNLIADVGEVDGFSCNGSIFECGVFIIEKAELQILKCENENLLCKNPDAYVFGKECKACIAEFTCDGSENVTCGDQSVVSQAVYRYKCVIQDGNKVLECVTFDGYYVNVKGECVECPSDFACDSTSVLKCGENRLDQLLLSFYSCDADKKINCGENVFENFSIAENFSCGQNGLFKCGQDIEVLFEILVNFTCSVGFVKCQFGNYKVGLTCFACMSGFECDGTKDLKCGDKLIDSVNASFYQCDANAIKCASLSGFYLDENLSCVVCPVDFVCNSTSEILCGEKIVSSSDILNYKCLLGSLDCATITGFYKNDLQECLRCPLGFICDSSSNLYCGVAFVSWQDLELFKCINGEMLCKESNTFMNSSLACQECLPEFVCNGTEVLLCGITEVKQNETYVYGCQNGSIKCVLDNLLLLENGSCISCISGYSCDGTAELSCGLAEISIDVAEQFQCVESVLKCGTKVVVFENITSFQCFDQVLTCTDITNYLGQDNTCLPCILSFTCTGIENLTCGSSFLPFVSSDDIECAFNLLVCKTADDSYIDASFECISCKPGFTCDKSQVLKCGESQVQSQEVAWYQCVDGQLSCATVKGFFKDENDTCIVCPDNFICNSTQILKCDEEELFFNIIENYKCGLEGLQCASIDGFYENNTQKCVKCEENFTCSNSKILKCGEFEVEQLLLENFTCDSTHPVCKAAESFRKELECFLCSSAGPNYTCNGTNILVCGTGKQQAEADFIENYTCDERLKCKNVEDITMYLGENNNCQYCVDDFVCDGSNIVKCGDVNLSSLSLTELVCQEKVLKCANNQNYFNTVDITCILCTGQFVCDSTENLSCGDNKLHFSKLQLVDCVDFKLVCLDDSQLLMPDQTCAKCYNNFTCNGSPFYSCGSDSIPSTTNSSGYQCTKGQISCQSNYYLASSLICSPCTDLFVCNGTDILKCNGAIVLASKLGELICLSEGGLQCKDQTTLFDLELIICEDCGVNMKCNGTSLFGCEAGFRISKTVCVEAKFEVIESSSTAFRVNVPGVSCSFNCAGRIVMFFDAQYVAHQSVANIAENYVFSLTSTSTTLEALTKAAASKQELLDKIQSWEIKRISCQIQDSTQRTIEQMERQITEDKSSGIGGGAVAAIVIVLLIVIGAGAGAGYWYFFVYKKKPTRAQKEEKLKDRHLKVKIVAARAVEPMTNARASGLKKLQASKSIVLGIREKEEEEFEEESYSEAEGPSGEEIVLKNNLVVPRPSKVSRAFVSPEKSLRRLEVIHDNI